MTSLGSDSDSVSSDSSVVSLVSCGEDFNLFSEMNSIPTAVKKFSIVPVNQPISPSNAAHPS